MLRVRILALDVREKKKKYCPCILVGDLLSDTISLDFTILIFIDFIAAFDTLDHNNILISRLEHSIHLSAVLFQGFFFKKLKHVHLSTI